MLTYQIITLPHKNYELRMLIQSLHYSLNLSLKIKTKTPIQPHLNRLIFPLPPTLQLKTLSGIDP